MSGTTWVCTAVVLFVMCESPWIPTSSSRICTYLKYEGEVILPLYVVTVNMYTFPPPIMACQHHLLPYCYSEQPLPWKTGRLDSSRVGLRGEGGGVAKKSTAYHPPFAARNDGKETQPQQAQEFFEKCRKKRTKLGNVSFGSSPLAVKRIFSIICRPTYLS